MGKRSCWRDNAAPCLFCVLVMGAVSVVCVTCAGEGAQESSRASPSATKMPEAPNSGALASGRPGSTPSAEPKATRSAQSATATVAVPAASPVTFAATWELTFQLTGGFAGLAERLTVDSQGRLTFEDIRRGRLTQGQLSRQEIAALERLLEDSEFFSQEPSQSRPCYDCFNYDIVLEQEGRVHSVQANSLGLDPRLAPLVERLTHLLEGELHS